MENLTYYRGLKIELVRDIDAESPREWENQWVLLLPHRRYNLGDAGSAPPPYAATTPIYAYEHGGIQLSLSPFSCPLDSGQIGVAWPKEDSATRESLEIELEIYNQYLNNDIWSFSIFCPEGELVESRSEFYGEDSAMEEAKRFITWYLDERRGSQVEITLV
jgi:hypothetical protein